jgi:peroxiredoxin
MKKTLLLLCFVPLLSLAQPPVVKGFVIDGKLDGYPDGTKITLYRNGVQTEWTSTKLVKGKFTLKEKTDEPVLSYIVIDGQETPIQLYVENAMISVKGSKANPSKYDISGSKSQKEFSEFTSVLLPINQQLSSIVTTINNTAPGVQHDQLMTTYAGLQSSIQREIDKFVQNNTKSAIAPFVLNVTFQFNDDVSLLETRFNLLDEKVKNLPSGRELKRLITEKKVGSVGSMALDFTEPDTTGKPISLSSFRGKYVLVDFWASWCGPCRNENPNVVDNYKRFSNKNFTILSVSLDRPGQKDKWVQAINMDNLTWTHVSDLQWWDNAAAKLYHIQAIPTNMLVDPDGKIVARNLRGPDLSAKLCEIFGCN